MADRADWNDLRERRMAEPGVAEAYDAARLAFELGPGGTTPPGAQRLEPESAGPGRRRRPTQAVARSRPAAPFRPWPSSNGWLVRWTGSWK